MNESPQDEPSHASPTPRNRGVGMLIITAYGIFAVSSFARALYQILTDFDASPVSYSLSAFAAAVYIVATVALAKIGPRAWLVALIAVLVELTGVLAVGLWTYLDPELFNEATVWSHFGEGYGFVPLVLPFIGLFWLLRHRPGTEAARGAAQRARR
ncbi:hypothetical protein I2485_07930 [Nesterenkonia sp. E16_7]|uniref:hypothetical protein n=1 Tax=unclassified Nesterenkonia TaxID=2629769 RepID=UPI001A92437D|nr:MULTISPECIES: hypothetical protein [unclassified Nesterenkonia]MBO0596213.1 hypothetical protein [Nesterenkonia sp. E16_10]MBO0598580.1 hypothetical protein [Nesterenkonia sp. E16_7]